MPYVTEDNLTDVSVPNNGTDLYLKSLPAWREEAKSGDEEVKYGHRTRT